MKVSLLSILSLLLMLAACNENDLLHPRPSDVLSGEQMIPLLVDIHLTDAALKLNQPAQQPGEIKLYYSRSFAPVFKKYKTTPAVFESSMRWYGQNIEKLDAIYVEVITQLSTLESKTRIKAKPNKSAHGAYTVFYPETDTSYLPDTTKALKIPFARPLR